MSVGINCTVNEFLKMDKGAFVEKLKTYINSFELPVGAAQVEAWKDCYDFLQVQLKQLKSFYYNTTLLFEYMLPLEKGRRPDVILLTKGRVVILEFKMKSQYKYKDIEQAIGYREDIKHFHAYTAKHNLQVSSFLVLTKANFGSTHEENGLTILTQTNFINILESILDRPMMPVDVDNWLSSPYQPVPNIIEATKNLFLKGELPYIKSIAEGDIASAVKKIDDLVKENEKAAKKRIIFLSGVPGAGKTLVGLKTVYDYNLYRYQTKQQAIRAIYLSGNGPLVNVLQYQLSTGTVNGLEGKAYIRGMLSYKREYLETTAVPQQTFIVFDEAQRAWDMEKMRKTYSEAEAILKIGSKIYTAHGEVTILCLIGDGQAIHTGEEKGMQLWIDALRKDKEWEVYIPPKYKEVLSALPNTIIEQELHLDTSIRTNFIDMSKWLEAVLRVDSQSAKEEFEKLKSLGFKIRVTRDFSKLQMKMPGLKRVYKQSKYGLLISSKAKSYEDQIKQYTNNSYKTSFVKDTEAGKWFMQDCEKLEIAASEFLCQGLEIDMPIVVFGGDYLIKGDAWNIPSEIRKTNSYKYRDLDTIIQNIYRVLLSRAKQGMILFIPNDSIFDETYEFFKAIGIVEY